MKLLLGHTHTHATKFVHLFRFSAQYASSSSRFNHFTTTNLKPNAVIRTLLSVKPLPRAFTFQSSLNLIANYHPSFRFSGIGIILGVSVASASTITHAMDAGDPLVDDPGNDSQELTEEEENAHRLWKLARKFWLPVFFFLTVLTNLDNPFTMLFIKLTLLLLSTKPYPFSVYIFVDQLCKRSMRQESHFLKVKSVYASKVQVQDYKLLCLAAVEVRDQKFTLVGILGSWWTLPPLPSREAFSLVRNRIGSILLKTTEQESQLI